MEVFELNFQGAVTNYTYFLDIHICLVVARTGCTVLNLEIVTLLFQEVKLEASEGVFCMKFKAS